MKKAIIVTGCAGFIGSNFVRQFRKQYKDIQIIGIDDLSTGRKSEIDKSIVFYKGSITNENFIRTIFEKHRPEYVFNFAALPRVSYSVEEPVKTSHVNILGVIILLHASVKHGVKRFIHSSSSSVYGGAKKIPTKESENFPDPKSPYAAQKYADETFCKVFSGIYGLETICLRYFNVYGPGQYGDSAYSTVISAWLESVYFPKNKKAFIEGNGKQSRDFCYVDNVVDANILAMKAKGKFQGDTFNVAHGERNSVNEIKDIIENLTNRKINLEKRPARKGDVLHTHADLAKSKKYLKFTPRIKFHDGMKRTVEWFETRIKN